MREEFLRAMMAGSVAAELCSTVQAAEEAFIGAMFQNLGRMLCEFYFPKRARCAAWWLQGRWRGEESASLQVLGLGFEDLGVGVARVWGCPKACSAACANRWGRPMRSPEQGVERLRWAAWAANEMASALVVTEQTRWRPASPRSPPRMRAPGFVGRRSTKRRCAHAASWWRWPRRWTCGWTLARPLPGC